MIPAANLSTTSLRAAIAQAHAILDQRQDAPSNLRVPSRVGRAGDQEPRLGYAFAQQSMRNNECADTFVVKEPPDKSVSRCPVRFAKRCEAFPVEVIDCGEEAEAAAVSQGIRLEIKAPALIAIGARFPSARLRPPRRPICSRSSRSRRAAFCGS